jgi:hypothetical protein
MSLYPFYPTPLPIGSAEKVKEAPVPAPTQTQALKALGAKKGATAGGGAAGSPAVKKVHVCCIQSLSTLLSYSILCPLEKSSLFFILYSLIFRYHLPVLSCPVLFWAESGLFLLRLPCSPFNNYIVIPLYRSVPRSPCLYLCPYPARFTPSRFNAFYLPSPLP